MHCLRYHKGSGCIGFRPAPAKHPFYVLSPWSAALCMALLPSAVLPRSWAVSGRPSQQVQAGWYPISWQPATVPSGMPNINGAGLSHMCQTGQREGQPHQNHAESLGHGCFTKAILGSFENKCGCHTDKYKGAHHRTVQSRPQSQGC